MPKRRRRVQAVPVKTVIDDDSSDDNNSISESEDDVKVKTSRKSSIVLLPEEILIHVFSYLNHADQLSARLVSTEWKQILSSWNGFNSKVVFLVKRSTDGRSVLKQSTVPWKKVRLEKFRLGGKDQTNFTLPPNLVTVTTSLEFCKSVVSWEGIRNIVTQFQSLEELNIIQCKRRRKETRSPPVELRMTRANRICKANYVDAIKNVKSMSLELRRVSDMVFYLNQFKDNIENLVNFSIKEFYDGVEITSPDIAKTLLESMFALIQRSRRSLKGLTVHFLSLNVINQFFVEVIQKLTDLNQLDLNRFEIRHFSPEPLNSRDMTVFSEFVISQRNLQVIRFPMPGDIPLPVCRKTVIQLTRKLRHVHVTHDKYMAQEFLDIFDELRQLHIDFEMRPYLLLGKKYPRLTSLEMQRGVLTSTVPLIADSFPNLVHLNLNGNCEDVPPLDDKCVQTICESLKKVRTLVLGACSRITDYGVSGVRREYCEKLFKSRAICMDPTMEIPAEEIIGTPLSSLKGLTHLVFAGATSISDVGIYYGFRFCELRCINMRNNPDISDWGLDWLGKLNPNIEELYMGCGPWVTSWGVNRMKSRLRRIKRRNCVFVWPHQEYYSSDESYAMESDDDLALVFPDFHPAVPLLPS